MEELKCRIIIERIQEFPAPASAMTSLKNLNKQIQSASTLIQMLMTTDPFPSLEDSHILMTQGITFQETSVLTETPLLENTQDGLRLRP